MRLSGKILTLFAGLFFPLGISAQNVQLSGKVSDAQGEALLGAGISPTGMGREGGMRQFARARCRQKNRTSPTEEILEGA